VAATLYHTITLFEEQVSPSRSDDTSDAPCHAHLWRLWGHIDAMVTKNAQEISSNSDDGAGGRSNRIIGCVCVRPLLKRRTPNTLRQLESRGGTGTLDHGSKIVLV
jgi:hypothetical protein